MQMVTSLLLRAAISTLNPWHKWVLIAALEIIHSRPPPPLDAQSLKLLTQDDRLCKNKLLHIDSDISDICTNKNLPTNGKDLVNSHSDADSLSFYTKDCPENNYNIGYPERNYDIECLEGNSVDISTDICKANDVTMMAINHSHALSPISEENQQEPAGLLSNYITIPVRNSQSSEPESVDTTCLVQGFSAVDNTLNSEEICSQVNNDATNDGIVSGTSEFMLDCYSEKLKALKTSSNMQSLLHTTEASSATEEKSPKNKHSTISKLACNSYSFQSCTENSSKIYKQSSHLSTILPDQATLNMNTRTPNTQACTASRTNYFPSPSENSENSVMQKESPNLILNTCLSTSTTPTLTNSNNNKTIMDQDRTAGDLKLDPQGLVLNTKNMDAKVYSSFQHLGIKMGVVNALNLSIEKKENLKNKIVCKSCSTNLSEIYHVDRKIRRVNKAVQTSTRGVDVSIQAQVTTSTKWVQVRKRKTIDCGQQIGPSTSSTKVQTDMPLYPDAVTQTPLENVSKALCYSGMHAPSAEKEVQTLLVRTNTVGVQVSRRKSKWSLVPVCGARAAALYIEGEEKDGIQLFRGHPLNRKNDLCTLIPINPVEGFGHFIADPRI